MTTIFIPEGVDVLEPATYYKAHIDDLRVTVKDLKFALVLAAHDFDLLRADELREQIKDMERHITQVERFGRDHGND